ncbi:major facilitator superfamily domain-containing protein [Paraphoma chrysanthemicola]|nr:major facilitator superfamily domain-containing protein [Paraphoma chrysanthemicola]
MSLWSIPHKSYMFFQLRHFDPQTPAATITTQCGLLVGAKTGAHVCTGLLWGRLADQRPKGRRFVLVFGLLASSAATVGYGFATTFHQAIGWQMFEGAMNATVAMVRCMTAELQTEKKYRVRAFTLLPLFANIGSVIGPLIGGFLSSTRTADSIVPGYPYAMPNICVAAIEVVVAVAAVFALTDTSRQEQRRIPESHSPIGRADSVISPTCQSEHEPDERTALLQNHSTASGDLGPQHTSDHSESFSAKEIWTPNVLKTMFAQFVVAGHLGTFTTLWAMLLSLPVASPHARPSLIHFSGGLGFQPHAVGVAMSALGFAGIILQILVYPSLQERWGTVRVWRAALCLFPIVYFGAPFCVLVPLLGQDLERQHLALYTILKWAALLGVLVSFVAARTGVVPATSLLINDCTPHSSVRGTVHTAGVICSNLSRSVFPPMALAVMGFGLHTGSVGLGFWFITILAVLSILASSQVREGPDGQ